MPPFIPVKRQSSEEPPPAKRHASAVAATTPASSSLTPASDSSLTPVPIDLGDGISDEDKKDSSDSQDVDSDEIDWEDAVPTPSAAVPATSFVSPHENLELTLDRNEVHLEDILQGQKAPSKIERQIRILIHRLHVQCLLAHNALRNDWINDSKLHDTLREKLPPAIQKEVQKWRRASGLEPPEPPKELPPKKKKGKQSKRQSKQRDWGEESARQEPGQPDLSNGDPIILLMRILAAYWKSKFKITAPGLRKHGYRSMVQLQTQIASFHKDKDDLELYGERIASAEEFRQAAERMEGSRDTGAQLFTALLRALNIEARLVASLQPLGFGWTKAESYTLLKPKPKPEETTKAETDGFDSSDSDDEDDEEKTRPSPRNRKTAKRPDHDLPFPIYWTEVASPITHQIISVDPLVLPNAVAATQELQANWEPRGAKAEKAKQVICYVIAFSPDRTAKEVTTRYLRRRTWPGKTKGFRLGKKGPDDDPSDWFRVLLRNYGRSYNDRTAVDDIEDAKDLVPNRPSKPKEAKETVDTLQSLRTSTEFVLERFLRREEALRPGAQPVRTFTPGGKGKAKAAKGSTSGTSTPSETTKAENVYRRTDIVKCQTAESWHKEGREPKPHQVPLKRVPIRAVTLLRKREVDEQARLTGQKPLQGLYSIEQTQEIIPPPIQDGIIPKNDYGNIDCFVPRMVPEGAVHIPFSGTARICKKLGIDYAEAVTGFEFGSQMAVPVIEGVVVAVENKDLVKDAWRADNEEKRKREARKAEAKILQTWRKFLFGLRIAERFREEYAGDEEGHLPDAVNPFASRKGLTSHAQASTPTGTVSGTASGSERPAGIIYEEEDDVANRGGGFLLGDDDDADDGELIVEERAPPVRRVPNISYRAESSGPEEEEEEEVELSPEAESPPPAKRRRTRNSKKA
ncbi:Rad4 transglutaminase-like domain-containing protein [Aspergillus venezuelensis]